MLCAFPLLTLVLDARLIGQCMRPPSNVDLIWNTQTVEETKVTLMVQFLFADRDLELVASVPSAWCVLNEFTKVQFLSLNRGSLKIVASVPICYVCLEQVHKKLMTFWLYLTRKKEKKTNIDRESPFDYTLKWLTFSWLMLLLIFHMTLKREGRICTLIIHLPLLNLSHLRSLDLCFIFCISLPS